MRLIPVHSSGVRAVGYEEERRVLSVQLSIETSTNTMRSLRAR